MLSQRFKKNIYSPYNKKILINDQHVFANILGLKKSK